MDAYSSKVKGITLLSSLVVSVQVTAGSYMVDTDSGSLRLDERKVYSSSKLTPNRRESIVPVSIITASDIEKFGINSFEQLFLLVPQLSVGYDGLGIDVVTGVNDFEPLRMQVLIDGIVAYGTGVLEMHWNRIPVAIDEISRIEVVHSPSSSVYGSNAFESIINIITKTPAEIGNKFNYVERGFERELFGHLELSNIYSDSSRLPFEHSTGLSIAYSDSDGFDALEMPSEALHLKYRSVLYLNQNHALDININYSHLETTHWDASWEDQPPTNDINQYSGRIDYDFRISPSSYFKATAAANFNKEEMNLTASFNPLLFTPEMKKLAEMYGLSIADVDELLGLPNSPEKLAVLEQYMFWESLGRPNYKMGARLKNNTSRYYGSIDYLHDFSTELRASFSTNYRFEEYDTDYAEFKDHGFQLNHSGELGYRTENLNVNGAVMAERIRNYDYRFPMRMGVNARIDDHWRIRTSYDSSYRWPSPFERIGRIDIHIVDAEDNPFGVSNGSSYAFYQQADNRGLKPERVDSVKLGTLRDLFNTAGHSSGLFESTIYFNRYKDLIHDSVTLINSDLNNDGEMDRTGVDLALSGYINRLDYRVGLSWARDSNASFFDLSDRDFNKEIDQYGFTNALSYTIEDTTFFGKYFWRYANDRINRQMYSAGALYKGFEDVSLSVDAQYIHDKEQWSVAFGNMPNSWVITAKAAIDF